MTIRNSFAARILAGRSDHREIHGIRDGVDGGIGLERVDGLGLGVDRKEGAVELVGNQVVKQRKADGVAVSRRTHNGNTFG